MKTAENAGIRAYENLTFSNKVCSLGDNVLWMWQTLNFFNLCYILLIA